MTTFLSATSGLLTAFEFTVRPSAYGLAAAMAAVLVPLILYEQRKHKANLVPGTVCTMSYPMAFKGFMVLVTVPFVAIMAPLIWEMEGWPLFKWAVLVFLVIGMPVLVWCLFRYQVVITDKGLTYRGMLSGKKSISWANIDSVDPVIQKIDGKQEIARVDIRFGKSKITIGQMLLGFAACCRELDKHIPEKISDRDQLFAEEDGRVDVWHRHVVVSM